MTTAFEYTSTFSIRLPEGAHMALEEEFEDAVTDRLSGLFPEAVTLWHEGGGTKQNWVYLAPAEEQWSGGWYHMGNLPEGGGGRRTQNFFPPPAQGGRERR